MSNSLTVFLGSLFLAAAALFLIGVATDDYVLRLASKPFPVAALITWVLVSAKDAVGRLTAAGLAFGLCGDILLEIGDATFLYGLISFLLGHIVYVVALSRAAGRLAPLQAVPMIGYVAVVAVVLVPKLGDMSVPVVLYMAAIAAMAWRAAALAEARGGLAWAALVGAVLFLFSDTLIAINRFVVSIEHVRPAIILTYWAGQAGIAAGVVLGRGQS